MKCINIYIIKYKHFFKKNYEISGVGKVRDVAKDTVSYHLFMFEYCGVEK